MCSDCAINKTHKLPFHQTTITSSRPLQYIFTDLWSSPVVSIDNYKYYLVLVDHYSRYTWLYPLKLKSQVKETFKVFKALVENYFSTKIGTLFSDNGGEFIALRHLLAEAGISHLTSPPHTLEHNGISERKHKHVVETCLTMLTHASMPKKYWTYAFSTAAYLINRQPTAVLNMDSPFHKLFGNQPNYHKLRVFGSLCFPRLRPYTAHKLEDRSTPCVFLGYSPTQSGYLCLQPHTGCIYMSRHVRFDELVFPFKTSSLPAVNSSVPNPEPTPFSPPVTIEPPSQTPAPTTFASNPNPSPPLVQKTGSSSSGPSLPGQVDSSTPLLSNTNDDNMSDEMSAESNHSAPAPQTSPVVSPLPSEQQEPSPSPSAQSSPSPEPAQPENTHPMLTRRKNQISKPNSKYNYSAALSSVIPTEPNTLNQALKDRRWRGSMSTEIDAFARNGTYDIVPRQPHYNVVGNRWLYKNKFNSDGSHNCCKSRLVAKEYKQEYGRDYTETFSPVIKATTLRLVLDIAISYSWPIQQLDVNNAFPKGLSRTKCIWINHLASLTQTDLTMSANFTRLSMVSNKHQSLVQGTHQFSSQPWVCELSCGYFVIHSSTRKSGHLSSYLCRRYFDN